MLLVAFIWSITANFDRIGLELSSPYFWVFSLHSALAVFFAILSLRYSEQRFSTVFKQWRLIVPLGMVGAVVVTAYMTALQYTLVIYAVSIKRLSVLFSTIWGWLYFKEQAIGQRIVGAAIMVLGSALICFS